MAGNRFHTASSHELKLFAAAFVAVLGCAALVNSSTRSAVAPPQKPSPTAPTEFEKQIGKPDPGFHPDKATEYIDKLALVSGGDWNKLSATDQRYVDSVTSGHGAIYLHDHAIFLRKQLAAKSNRADKRASRVAAPAGL